MICYVLAMGKQHLGPHAVVGYGIKIFVPRPLHYVTRSPGYITGTTSYDYLRGSLPTTSLTFYLKLPYIGRFSVIIRKKIVMI